MEKQHRIKHKEKKVLVYTVDGFNIIGATDEQSVHCPVGYIHDGVLLIVRDRHGGVFVTREDRLDDYFVPENGLALGTHIYTDEDPDAAAQRLTDRLGLREEPIFTGCIHRAEVRDGKKDNEVCKVYHVKTSQHPFADGRFVDLGDISRIFPEEGVSPTVDLVLFMGRKDNPLRPHPGYSEHQPEQ